jgi:GNAT superfamily N-acetyltransferase
MRVERVAPSHKLLRVLHTATFPRDEQPEWESGTWWLVFDGERAIAFAGLTPSVQFSDCGYLVRAGVLPAWRGRGLQKRLLRVRERFARSVGLNWLVTATYQNTASSNSLIAAGYRLYEPSRPWLDKGALYWRKQLKAD